MTQHATEPHQVPPRRRRTGPIAAAAAVLAAATAAGGVWWAMRPDDAAPYGLAGQVVIRDTDPTALRFTWDENPDRCSGEEQYSDLVPGASVVVADERGKTLAVGKLGMGVPGGIEESSIGQVATTCTFEVLAAQVPARDFYRITVARQPVTIVAGPDVEHLAISYGS